MSTGTTQSSPSSCLSSLSVLWCSSSYVTCRKSGKWEINQLIFKYVNLSSNYALTYHFKIGSSDHILLLGEVQRSSSNFVTPSFSSSDVFCFVGLPFFPSASWPLFFLSLFLFFLFFRPCLLHARLPDWGRAFVHGHTFLHSWSGPMKLVVGLLHGATFLSNLSLVPFVSFIGP